MDEINTSLCSFRPYLYSNTATNIVLTIFINILVAVFEYRYGRKLQSEVLISDSIHTKSDIFISIGVLITIILIKLIVQVIIYTIVLLFITVFIFIYCVEICIINIV